MQSPRQLVIHHREQYEFLTRHFKVLGDTMATKAAATSPKIDLGTLSNRTAENLDALAKRTAADWAVNLVVEEAKLDSSAEGGFKVRTRVRLQVWDVRRQGWLADHRYLGQASGAGSPVLVFRNSLDEAVKGSLANLLHVYPQVVSVLEEGSLKDYLAGQTAPFIADTNTSFSGLKAKQ